jgi:serine/threonine-protein kinase RsbW
VKSNKNRDGSNNGVSNLEDQIHSEINLSISADLSNLPKVRKFVQRIAIDFCGHEQFAYDYSLAVDELVTNIILHGYQGKPGTIEIQVLSKKREMCIILRDDAFPFDPTQVKDPNIHLALEERQIGGLGVYMARILTDEMTYHWTPEGGNELRLIKRCSDEQPQLTKLIN